jgi:hypothetical protein
MGSRLTTRTELPGSSDYTTNCNVKSPKGTP